MEVEGLEGDGAYRSTLRKALLATVESATGFLSGSSATTFNAMVLGAYKCLACLHGLLAQQRTSFLAHVSAVEFWEQHLSGVTHVALDELRKG